jgi:hypothetical protein
VVQKLGLVKAEWNLRSFVIDATQSVKSFLAEARADAEETKQKAGDALSQVKQADTDIKATQRDVSALRANVTVSAGEVQDLRTQTQKARDQLAVQSQQVEHLIDQVHAVQTARNVADVQAAYPLFGEHRARTWANWIPKEKQSDGPYVSLNFDIDLSAPPQNGSAERIAGLLTALKDHKFVVLLGPINVFAVSTTGTQQLGPALGLDGCGWPAPALPRPCVFYFRADLKTAAFEARDIVKPLGQVPDNRIVFVDPKGLDSYKRELLDLSHVDIAVVLGRP